MNAAAAASHPEAKFEHVCSYWATVGPPEIIGQLPEGFRLTVYVTNGEITGSKLKGRVRPVGGDWLTLRTDGVGILDVRATFELEDGALIYTAYSGVMDLGPDGYTKLVTGEGMPLSAPIRIAPRYYTSHADYLWLNRLQCFGVGQVDFQTSRVTFDIYTVP